MTVYSVVRGDEDTVIFRRKVEKSAVYKSLAVMILGILAVTITAAWHRRHDERHPRGHRRGRAFRRASPHSRRVGLSAGISAVASTLSRILLIFEMYIGRLGPVTFFLALAMRPTANRKEILPVGKIQIG